MDGEEAVAWHGLVVAESLKDPLLISDLTVYKTAVTEDGKAVDYAGGLGRWHIFWVEAIDSEVDAIQRGLLHGWYAHFWQGDDLLVVFDDARFRVSRSNESTWEAAREHGRDQGIPYDELDFVSDETPH